MKELINTGIFKKSPEDILFECLKNITISIFHQKGEEFRKTLCSNDSKELDKLLRSIIHSTFLEFNLEESINQIYEKNKLDNSIPKKNIIENIIKRAVYMKEEQVMLVYMYCIMISKSNNTHNYPLNMIIENFRNERLVNSLVNKDITGKEINLSLNSNSKNESSINSSWGMEEKGDLLISNFIENREKLIPSKNQETSNVQNLSKRKRMKLFAGENSFEINSDLKEKGIIDKNECRYNLNDNNLKVLKSQNNIKNENLKFKDSYKNLKFKQIREHVPSFLKKCTGISSQSGNNQLNTDNNLTEYVNQSKIDNFNGKINMNNKTNNIDNNIFKNLNEYSDQNYLINNDDNPIQVITSEIIDKNNENLNLGHLYSNNRNYSEKEYIYTKNEIKKNQNILSNEVSLVKDDFHEKNKKLTKEINNYFDSLNRKSQFINNINIDKNNILNSNNIANNSIEKISQNLGNHDNILNKGTDKNPIIKSHSSNIADKLELNKSIKSPLKLILNNKEKNYCFEPVKLKENLKRGEKDCLKDEIIKFNSWSNPNNVNKIIYNSMNDSKQKTNINSELKKEDLNCESNIAIFNSVNSSINNFSRNISEELFKSCDVMLHKGSQRNDLLSTMQNGELYDDNIQNKNFFSSNTLEDNNIKKKFNENNNNIKNFCEAESFNNFFNFLNYDNENEIYDRDNVFNNSKDKSFLIDNNFPLEAKFITNNKKIFFKEETNCPENIYHNIDKNEKKSKNTIPEKLKYNEDIMTIKNTNQKNYYCENLDPNFLVYNNDSNAREKNLIYIKEYNSATNDENLSNLDKYINNKKDNNQFLSKKPFNNLLELENNALIKEIDLNKNYKKISYAKNDLTSKDFIKKYNTSDAIRPPKIFLDLNDVSTLNNLDPTLIVTAEIDKKKNILHNYRSTYSNQRSNRSTSNESKEFNSNNNINNYNSKEVNNIYYNLNSNNSGNYINFDLSNNLKLATNSNKNIYSFIKNKEINKTYNEKKKIAILNEKNSDLISDNLSINYKNLTNSPKSNISNVNSALKKKIKQENQIFFPTEINIFEINDMNNNSINQQIPLNKNYIIKESKVGYGSGKFTTGIDNELYTNKNKGENKEDAK